MIVNFVKKFALGWSILLLIVGITWGITRIAYQFNQAPSDVVAGAMLFIVVNAVAILIGGALRGK